MLKPAIVWTNQLIQKSNHQTIKKKTYGQGNEQQKEVNMKPQDIGLPSGCFYKYLWWTCKLVQTSGSIQLFWVTNGSIRFRHQHYEVASVTHIEDLKSHFPENDIWDNNDDQMDILQIKWILFHAVVEVFTFSA